MKRFCMIFLAAIALAATATAQTEELLDPIVITYDGATASVDIPDGITDVFQMVSGANVIIISNTTTQEYIYEVKGQSDDGSLTVNGSYKLTLRLAGVSLTNNHGGAAIDIECGKRTAVELVEGTTNTLMDAATGSQKAALYFKGHPEFQGGGTLNVTGRLKHAISAKEYLEIKKSTGTINILGAMSDGIHCGRGTVDPEKNYFLMKGGTVNILQAGSDGIDADDYGALRILGGQISVNVDGTSSTGLKADSTITISDGTIAVAVKGKDSEAIRSSYKTTIEGGTTSIVVTGDGSKGIKTKREETVTATSTVMNGGFMTMSGGSLDIKTLGDNFIEEATEDTKRCLTMSIDADYEQTGGDIVLTAMGPDAAPFTVKGINSITGGSCQQRIVPWKLDELQYQYAMTVYATIEGTGLDGLCLVAYCGEECRGLAWPVALPSNGSVFMMRVYSNEPSGETISFKSYKQEDGEEVEFKGTVSFQNDQAVGEPGNPLVLRTTAGILGDVNNDGLVDMTDAISIVYHYLGETPTGFNIEVADMNGDSLVDMSDAITLVYMYLSPGPEANDQHDPQ